MIIFSGAFRPTTNGNQYDFRRKAEAWRRRRTERENERELPGCVEEVSTRRLALITTNKKEFFPCNGGRYLDMTCGQCVFTLTRLKINFNKKCQFSLNLLVTGYFRNNYDCFFFQFLYRSYTLLAITYPCEKTARNRCKGHAFFCRNCATCSFVRRSA